MRRGYAVAFFVVYAVCLLVTAYVESGGMPLFALAFVVGEAALLPVGVALAFPYMTALIPAAVAILKEARPRTVAAWAVFGLAFLAVGLPLLSQLIAAAGLALAHASSIDHGKLPRPNIIEFVTNLRPGGSGTYVAPCGALCQQLLTTNAVKRVVVSAVIRGGKLREFTHRVGYHVAEMSGPCPATFWQPDEVMPGTLAAAAEGRCLLADIGDTTPGDVTVSNRFFAEGDERVLEISSPSKGVVRRMSAPRFYVLEIPFHLAQARGCTPTLSAWHLRRTKLVNRTRLENSPACSISSWTGRWSRPSRWPIVRCSSSSWPIPAVRRSSGTGAVRSRTRSIRCPSTRRPR